MARHETNIVLPGVQVKQFCLFVEKNYFTILKKLKSIIKFIKIKAKDIKIVANDMFTILHLCSVWLLTHFFP